MCDPALAKGADVRLAAGLAVTQLHPGAQFLAVMLVRDAEHLHLEDLRMAIKEFLDLARVDVLAAADHDVLDPAYDIAITLVVDHREISGMHPARRVDRLLCLL